MNCEKIFLTRITLISKKINDLQQIRAKLQKIHDFDEEIARMKEEEEEKQSSESNC